MIQTEERKLIYHYDAEEVWIEPWGDHSIRVRASKMSEMQAEDYALEIPEHTSAVRIYEKNGVHYLQNGRIIAGITRTGKISIYREDGKLLMEEYVRNRQDAAAPGCSALEIEAREYVPIKGGDYHITVRWESLDRNEKLYGMGQYQQENLNLKGTDIELAQRNSQASVPFVISSLGYGMLWNDPAVGRAVFGVNKMTYEVYSSKQIDYWVTAGYHPAEILEAYAEVTGKAPEMPEYGLGFWQCKLRYQTQEELLEVAREYKRRQLPIDVIVVDFFHWPMQGEWKFDPVYWPDPEGMIRKLNEMGIHLMVSVWPTVDKRSENYAEMLEKGYLIRTERGYRIAMDFEGDTVHFDATNPKAGAYVWDKAKKNYYDKGVRIFWLDEAEPEYAAYDFDQYRYFKGPVLQIGNIYPREYAKIFYEGMKACGQEKIVNLLRCAWAGSQKYGALVWSGDIASSFVSMRRQIRAGLNMGLAGIPWWTTDIGGFHGGNPDDPKFRELFVRWFQWGVFCPVMRLHGDREPRQPQVGTTGGATCRSGAPNEVWSYGEEVYEICKKYMELRERLRPYIRKVMAETHEKGTPVMRTLFYMYPEDAKCWDVEDEYFFGPDILVAPICYEGERSRKAYLPEGETWVEYETGKEFGGGVWIEADAPIERIPVFVNKKSRCTDGISLLDQDSDIH